MKNLESKILDIKFGAPLVTSEEEYSNMRSINTTSDIQGKINNSNNTILCGTSDIIENDTHSSLSENLENLVNTFDEKITTCFKNYGTNVESLAPVQIRSQEEIMKESQMWWAITGTFNNILAVDWTKSHARKMHVPALNLNQSKKQKIDVEDDFGSEDEAIAMDLDMHTLILSPSNDEYNDQEPVKTADEILKEIDDIMQENSVSDLSAQFKPSIEKSEIFERSKEVLSLSNPEKKLNEYSLKQLSDLLNEIESLISALSEILINELALRDELEYEKELKNQFISTLLAVQNRRRQHHVTEKKNQHSKTSSIQESKYLTTVIPYNADNTHLDNEVLIVLIKILKAINENNPAVPGLLTDYILKVLCPT